MRAVRHRLAWRLSRRPPEGTLAPHPRGGAYVLSEFGPQSVEWPIGYTVSSMAGGKIQLLDPGLNVVASEGEQVYIGGGMSADNTNFVACGYVSNQPP